MGPLILNKYLSEEDIKKRVKEIAVQLSDKFNQQEVVAICVLKGSFVFYSDLIREMTTDVVCDFISCSSYGNTMTTSGHVKLTSDLSSNIEDQHVLLIEDIVDTGLTMNYLQNYLKLKKPKSLTSTTLLHKPDAKKVDSQLDVIGFDIPNEFVVGYGLDYQGMYRNLPYVAQVQNMN